jgi:PAS domain S-box-containing protein
MFGFKKNTTNNAKSFEAGSLRDEKLKTQVIIDNIDDGVLLIDDKQTIQLCNPAAGIISGWPVDEATGINVQNVMTMAGPKGEVIDAEENPFTKLFEDGQPVHDNKAVLQNRSKNQVAIMLSITPLLDANKNVTGAIAVFRDVSEERAEEQQRADFISTASHEMRTPVAAIEGYLSLSLNEKVATIDNRARDFLEKAHSSTQHLGQLFQDLLTSAKAEDRATDE